MKQFEVPIIYRSPLITAIKRKRKDMDRMKKDFSPTLLDFGGVQIFLARHFGFCYGVENAIDIAFKTIEENPGKRIFLLSEMIHNPQVNGDLQALGVKFLQDTKGNNLVPFEELVVDDIVLIPAFGTTLEIGRILEDKGIKTEKYNTTCPFVEKVWNRSAMIARQNYTIIIHGKPGHEETRATFSHASASSASLVIRNLDQANLLAKYISGEKEIAQFSKDFEGQFSKDFDPGRDLKKIGVVNQTTMLASETQAIADLLKNAMTRRYAVEGSAIEEHFADTRDTLCYATNDNQHSVINLLEVEADLAIVVGGYNSSNTSHLVELCEGILPTYFVSSEEKIVSPGDINHFDIHRKIETTTAQFLPNKKPVRVLITSGASCPDALVEGVIGKLTEVLNADRRPAELVSEFV